MARVSHLELLDQAIREQGVEQVAAKAGLKPKQVRKFLNTHDATMSRWSRLMYATGIEVGAMHLLNLATGRCTSCDGGPEAHMPLFPEKP